MKACLSLVFSLLVITGFATSYTFTGNGNWTVAANWSNNTIPPTALPAGDTIYISPAPGNTCILNTVQTILQGAGLVVTPGANFVIAGSLNINQSAPLPNAKICNQTWATKNLDVTRYRNGDSIPQVSDQAQWESLRTGAWCYYNNESTNNAVYGKLYNWYAVNDPRGLAPAGWHIPSDTEWTILVNTCLGGNAVAGGKMKFPGTAYWQSPNAGANNSSGFGGLPGGSRFNFLPSYPAFTGIKEVGYWWSTTEIWNDVEPTAGIVALNYNGTDVLRAVFKKLREALYVVLLILFP